jgi:hypothetical protein
MANGKHLTIPDVSVFFELVQSGILRDQSGEFIDAVSDLNIRRGLHLVRNFLTSGHIEADKALRSFVESEERHVFPFHEIFKGTMLGQWRYYREDRSECVNVFDARLGSRGLRLLRLALLRLLFIQAQSASTLEVPVSRCLEALGRFGASENHIVECLTTLREHGLVRTTTAHPVSREESVVLTRSGGYYLQQLAHKLVYVEECMFDTAIDDAKTWDTLLEITQEIQREAYIPRRTALRQERINPFLDYLLHLEEDMLVGAVEDDPLRVMPAIAKSVRDNMARAIIGAERLYGQGQP